MGLLKHLVIPLLALVHGAMTGIAFLTTGGLRQAMIDARVLPADYEFTPFEDHLLQVFGGVHMILFLAAVIGVVFEDSHYRGIYIVLDMLYFGTVTFSDYQHNYPYQVGLGLTIFAGVGAIVHHFMEPGLFTKDKKEKAKSG